MFLLSSERVRSEQARGQAGLLEIQPFIEASLGPTYYYFSLGRFYRKWEASRKQWVVDELGASSPTLRIDPDDYILVQSLERFRCSQAILGIFGPASELLRRGLSLRNSLFIDPCFPGAEPGFLEIGLVNEINVPILLRLGEKLGKLSFFNVSDTYPVELPLAASTRADYERRKGSGPPLHIPPEYDDHPIEGYEEIVNAGRRKRSTRDPQSGL